MYDILNHFYLDIEIEHISVSKNELAKRNLKHLREIGIRQPGLASIIADTSSRMVFCSCGAACPLPRSGKYHIPLLHYRRVSLSALPAQARLVQSAHRV
jgi:hypothetical protein